MNCSLTIPSGIDIRSVTKSAMATFLMYVLTGTMLRLRCFVIAKQTAKFPMIPARAMNDSTVSRTITNQVGSIMMSTVCVSRVMLVGCSTVVLLKNIIYLAKLCFRRYIVHALRW